MDKRIKFYSQNTNLLPPKPKSSFRHLKQGIQEFHRKHVLVPADKAANNVVVVCRPSGKHLRMKPTPDLHLTYSKNGENQGLE